MARCLGYNIEFVEYERFNFPRVCTNDIKTTGIISRYVRNLVFWFSCVLRYLMNFLHMDENREEQKVLINQC